MKTRHKIGMLAMILGAMVVGACSNIAEDERLIYVEPAAVNRAVLIEDFTGQKCVNCPNATNTIHQIQEAYGEETVIAVAIHCGPFGLASGLMTDLGQTYWNNWFSDTQGQPVAKINRGAANDEYKQWAGVVANELTKTTDVSLELKTAYNETSREVSIDIAALGKVGVKEKLQIWVVEDGIVAAQKQPDGSTNKQYVHNHVLREAVNGDWGEDITYTEIPVTLHRAFVLNEKYVADNCAIVAFTYGEQGVSQAIIKRIQERIEIK